MCVHVIRESAGCTKDKKVHTVFRIKIRSSGFLSISIFAVNGSATTKHSTKGTTMQGRREEAEWWYDGGTTTGCRDRRRVVVNGGGWQWVWRGRGWKLRRSTKVTRKWFCFTFWYFIKVLKNAFFWTIRSYGWLISLLKRMLETIQILNLFSSGLHWIYPPVDFLPPNI